VKQVKTIPRGISSFRRLEFNKYYLTKAYEPEIDYYTNCKSEKGDSE